MNIVAVSLLLSLILYVGAVFFFVIINLSIYGFSPFELLESGFSLKTRRGRFAGSIGVSIFCILLLSFRQNSNFISVILVCGLLYAIAIMVIIFYDSVLKPERNGNWKPPPMSE